jgi:hypothetical protein
MCLDFPELVQRLAGPAAVLLLVAGAALTAASGAGGMALERPRQIACLALGAIAAVESSWAFLDPDCPAPWLHRQVLVLAVMVVMAALYGAWPWSGYRKAARTLAGALGALAIAVLALVLMQEFASYDSHTGHTPLTLSAVILVAVLLTAIIVGGLWLAVSKRFDPFGLSPRGRVRCVWGAEFVVVLLVVHLRLNVPELFHGFLEQHWAVILMALGFAGVGLGELCQRRRLPMLAEPLQRTGLFLPLLPVLAYLVRPAIDFDEVGQAMPGIQPVLRHLQNLPDSYQLNALLWFLLGILYIWMTLLKRTSAFALVGALFTNFGLWVILAHQEGMGFLLHPQLWLIPVGLIVLAAEHLHRERLTAAQSQAARYLGLLLIYLSSTADMFITGMGNSVLLPLALAVLCVIGVLAGILLRVRAFLFLGVTFLFLVIFAQIWHAAVDRAHTWIWWASGIVLGAAILTLFALFEKRRNDVLKLFDEIKRWK